MGRLQKEKGLSIRRRRGENQLLHLVFGRKGGGVELREGEGDLFLRGGGAGRNNLRSKKEPWNDLKKGRIMQKERNEGRGFYSSK